MKDHDQRPRLPDSFVRRVETGPAVLNRYLYHRLAASVGPVTVVNPGVPAHHPRRWKDWSTGKERTRFRATGEAYVIACPFCGGDLRIGYLWCVPDPFTGERMRHLAFCRGGDCLSTHYREFEATVFDSGGASSRTLYFMDDVAGTITYDDGPGPKAGGGVPPDGSDGRPGHDAYEVVDPGEDDAPDLRSRPRRPRRAAAPVDENDDD